MSMQGSFNAGNINDIEIEIDAQAIGQMLASNPAFIAAIAKAVRDQLTRDARTMGNLYGNYAQKQPAPPSNTRRLN